MDRVPTLYAHARLGFGHAFRLGKHLHGWSVSKLAIGILLAALIATAIVIVRSHRRRKKREPAIPGWICSSCHEENPAKLSECWNCQLTRGT
jgi:hypothetical protein